VAFKVQFDQLHFVGPVNLALSWDRMAWASSLFPVGSEKLCAPLALFYKKKLKKLRESGLARVASGLVAQWRRLDIQGCSTIKSSPENISLEMSERQWERKTSYVICDAMEVLIALRRVA
jgi:hypothetical protein